MIRPLPALLLLALSLALEAPPAGAQQRELLAEEGLEAFLAVGQEAWTDDEWILEGGVLRFREGARDLRTRETFADVHLALEFRLEPGTDTGLFLADRWELVLADTGGEEPGVDSCGALRGRIAPRVDACGPAGTWQRLDVAYQHSGGSDPLLTVWLNDEKVLDRVPLTEPTVGGARTPLEGTRAAAGLRYATAPGDPAPDLGRPFSISACFRSRGAGTLVAKCPSEGPWVANAKALFLRGGRLVHDIGWVGALTSERRFDDGRWHRVVLTTDGEGTARMFVDGREEGVRMDFRADDEEGFVLKVGAANEDFGGDYEGELRDVRVLADALAPEEARAVSAAIDTPPDWRAFLWNSLREHGVHLPAPGEPVPAPLRLRSDPGLALRGLTLTPLGEVDHAGLVEEWSGASYERGEAIYSGLCVACHGADGRRTPNPKARPFVTGALENGADPYSLFGTITHGFREMPGNAWLRPDQRYDVIHFLRERFLRDTADPQRYTRVDAAYLNSLPKGRTRRPADDGQELVQRDFGPALGSQLGDEVGAALTVRLDEDASIAYDLQLMASPAAWTGGFLDLSRTHHHQQRGEGKARPAGRPIEGLGDWAWGYGGSLEWDRRRRADRAPLPTEMLEYHGYHVHGEQVVLAYAVDGREVLEQPGIDRTSGLPVFTHRLRVEDGEAELVLRLLAGEQGAVFERESLPGPGGLPLEVLVRRRGADGTFAAVALVGAARLELDTGPDGERALLRLPADGEARELWVLRHAGRGEEQLAGLRALLAGLAERELPPSPTTLLGGGPPRWGEELVTRGELGAQPGAYAVDTLTLPASNPWNAWLRTSALDFFPDGRAAVATYGGDVWIVEGIDADLERLTWRRFAAGLFEPMGLLVVDGKVLVTGRDRITRLHDLDGNGEADFHESFFADPDVSTNFHAFSFDLQRDGEGFLYYAKSGQYTDYDRGGAILRVAPDGSSWSEWCLGLRTPNGMGMSPDGLPLVSDNQGNWVPASKVALTTEGSFHGVFPSIATSSPGLRTRASFDPPVLWMPQSFDSSSGGQLWVDDPRFGPLSGRYLHTSFGKGWMYPLVIDREAPLPQAAAWRLPFQFAAGIQRLRVNPADGQVYTVGLSGWQGPSGGADGCLQRVRHTGREELLLVSARSTAGGVELSFAGPLEGVDLLDPAAYAARRWNYRWARGYGSDHYSVERPAESGEDEVAVTGVRPGTAPGTVEVLLASQVPCDQLALEWSLATPAGVLEQEVLLTVNSVPAEEPLLRRRAECEDEVGLPWLTFEGGRGPGAGRHVVLIAGDEEYRSEECLPELGRILAEQHGFRATVLFSIDPATGTIDPMEQTFTPGLDTLAGADLVVLFTRFREWPDADMAHFVRYVESGRPLVGIRTATHAFDHRRRPDGPHAHYSWRNPRWPGGFGKQVLGETWVAHHGGHGSQATRGVVAPAAAEHPILRGVEDVFCPTDVYTVGELPADARVLLYGQVVDGMDPEDPPAAGALNDPMMPVLWCRERPLAAGGIQRCVTSTVGSSQGFRSEGLRRAWVNACFWALGLEVPERASVDLREGFPASPFGYGAFLPDLRPADLRSPTAAQER